MTLTTEDIVSARQNALPIEDYLDSISKLYKWKFLEQREAYELNEDTLAVLEDKIDNHFVLAFSAQWCKDCSKNIPILSLISERTGLEVGVFGKIKTDALSKERLWRVPPSPEEVLTFEVLKLPWMVIYDQNCVEVGKIIENPIHTGSLEEEVLHYLENPAE